MNLGFVMIVLQFYQCWKVLSNTYTKCGFPLWEHVWSLSLSSALCRGQTKFCRKTKGKNLLGLFWCLYCSVLEQCYLVRESLFQVALSAWTFAVFPSLRSILSFCLLLTATKFKQQRLNVFPIGLMCSCSL